jgi:predicted amidohydrolase
MKLSLAQFDVARANPEANLARIAELAEEANASASDLLCLPEMCTSGFDWRFNREHLNSAAAQIESVASIARANRIAICGSFLEKTESGNPANCFHYFDADGALIARYRKLHLFTLFHEEKHVEAGKESVTFDTDYGRIGAAVCYDLRFPELFRRTTEAGAVLQVLPAAFPHPRLDHWRTLVQARAIENQTYFVGINQCGVEGHGSKVGKTHYFGHSMVVDPWGKIIAEAGEAECLLSLEIDLSEVDKIRSKLSAWEDRRNDVFGAF